MTVVWHAVPRNMIGDTVYPLTELRRVDAAAYESQRAKYAGREVVLDFRVPVLDVPFNATVHCSPVHPYRVFAARRLAGFEVQAKPAASSMITGLFFEIPVQRILVHEVLWYAWRAMWANGAPNEDAALAPPPEEFERFDPTRYIPLADVPPAHRDYLVARKANGRPALTFVHIPHVLVAGPIDVGGCRIISWSDPPDPVPPVTP